MTNWINYVISAVVVHSVFAALPKSAWDCDNSKIESKYFNEECAVDNDCFGIMACQKGRCACKDNQVTEERFVGERGKQTICVPAPSLFAECKTICQKPFKCEVHQEAGGTEPGKKVCQCVPPFQLTNGVCQLVCAENQRYKSDKFICIDKCGANQIAINDSCLPVVQLNDACSSELQCQPAYTQCVAGKCACLDGFQAKDGLCTPETVVCPSGKTLSVAEKNVVECTVKSRRGTPSPNGYVPTELYDTCPDKHHCLMIGGTYRSENSTGYCCPIGETRCPVGQPHGTGQCRAYGRDKECPWHSHYCHSTNHGQELCCPKRCKQGQVLVNGRCYQSVSIGEPCSVDQQCLSHLTACVNGACQCTKGSTEKKQATYSYCSIDCQPGELVNDNKCHKPLSLGESCKNQTWRCPPNAFCNKHEVCSCACPRFTLSKDVCAPVPTCPKPMRHLPYSGRAMIALDGASIKGYEPISETQRSELLQNVTFCAIPNKEAPKVQVVAQCPENQYCANYIDNLGICCRIPEYVCPSGKKPTVVKNCDTRNPLSCGVDQYCHHYLHAVDPNSTVSKMCCAHDKDEEPVLN